MNDKLIFEIVKYVAIFFISIFLPKKIIYFFRSLLEYCLNILFKYWYVYILEIIIFFIFHFYRNSLPCNNYIAYESLFLLLSITFLFSVVIKIIILFFKKPTSFLTIYPTFTIKENEFIARDIQSEKINDIIVKNINFLESKFFIYRNKFIRVSFETIPAFLVTILGLKGYKKLITRNLNRNNPISIYFQKDLLDSELTIELFYDKEQFVNTYLFKEFDFFNTIIGKSKSASIEKKLEDILYLYYFLTSQSMLDLLLNLEQYEHVANTLNDIEEQLPLIIENLKIYGFEEILLNEFNNSWRSIVKRYFSLIFIQKKEYQKAVDYIIEANNINSYFPQSSYESAKRQYIAKYLSEMLPKVRDAVLEVEIDNYNFDQLDNLTDNYLKKLEYENYQHNYQILIEIINICIENKDTINYIKEKLHEIEIDNNNIFSLIFIAESYKYIPTDNGEKVNSIYIDQIPKTVELLEKAINIDKDFELLYLRVGSLKVLYATDKDEKEMQDAFQYIEKYVYLYTKYGLQ